MRGLPRVVGVERFKKRERLLERTNWVFGPERPRESRRGGESEGCETGVPSRNPLQEVLLINSDFKLNGLRSDRR